MNMQFLVSAIVAIVCTTLLYRGTNFDPASPIRKIFSVFLGAYAGGACWFALRSWITGIVIGVSWLVLFGLSWQMNEWRKAELLSDDAKKFNPRWKKFREKEIAYSKTRAGKREKAKSDALKERWESSDEYRKMLEEYRRAQIPK